MENSVAINSNIDKMVVFLFCIQVQVTVRGGFGGGFLYDFK